MRKRRLAFTLNFYLDVIEILDQPPAARAKVWENKEVESWSPMKGVSDSLLEETFLRNLHDMPITRQRIVLIALASERYFLKKNRYAKNLDELNI